MSKKKKNQEKPSILDSFSGSIGSDYIDEQEEISEEDVIVVDIPHKSHKETIKKAASFTFGLLVLVFAVIGVISVSVSTANFFSDLSSNKALREEFEFYIFPVVATDMPKFDTAENLPSSTVISASIAKIILTGDTSKYTNEYGLIYIPEFDVESNATSLFGSGVKIEHDTVRYGQHVFSYYPETKVYGVYESSNIANYSPKITEITNVGESYTLKVDYYPPAISIPGLNKETTAVKTMIYSVSKSGDKKTITGIEAGFNDYEH